MIKKIGNDSLVLMTPNQGHKINKKYSTLIDSVNTVKLINRGLNGKINMLNNDISNLNSQNDSLNGTLKSTLDSLNNVNKKFIKYKAKYEKLEYKDWMTRAQVKVGIGLTIVTWITLFVFSSKN